MKIDKTVNDNGTATIKVVVEPSDVKDKYNAAIKDYSSKAQIKGFRKGKVPANFIKKMYGHGILADTINTVMQDALLEYIKEEKLDIIGQPIPSQEDGDQVELDPFKLEAKTFNFDIGLSPEVEIKPLSDLGTYTKYEVEIPNDIVQEELDNGAKRLGTQESTDEPIEENDMVTIKAQELDGNNVKEGGHETEFVFLVSMVKDDEAKAKVIGAKKEDTLDFDIYTLENGSSDDYVAKYLLKLEDPSEAEHIGRMFRGEITEVKRVVPAEKDAEFFQKLVGDDSIETEDQAKELIASNIKKHYDKESDNLMKGRIASDLIDAHPIEFPEEFMKRWIEVATENAQSLDLDQEYQAYAKQLQWTLIKSKLMDQHKLEVTEEDIKAAARERVMSYFGGAASGVDEAMIEGIIPRLLNDQQQLQQIYSGVEFDKLMDALAQEVKTKVKKLNTEEFKDVVEKYNEEMAAKNA